MVDCWLPYGDTEVYVSVELESLMEIAELVEVEPEKPATEILTDALMEPSGQTLEALIEPGVDVVIAVDVYSSPQAVVQALGLLIKILVELIIPKDRITIILGNGEFEKENRILRTAIYDTPELRDIQLIDHNRNSTNLVELGETIKGTPVEINRRYHEAKLKIAIGETRIDYLTGYAGAHSSIIPGLASPKTIKEYKRTYFDTEVTPGTIELNPIKEDVLEAVAKTGIDFALNLVTNKEGRIIAAHGGGYEESWGKAINSLADKPEITTEGNADIVITSAGGAPYDQSLYQSLWALRNASKAAKRNGTIVLLAQCVNGLGAEAFTQLARVDDISELKRRYMIGAEALSVLKTIQKNNRVILVSALPGYLVDSLGLDNARTANEAYQRAIQSRRGRKTIVIPHGNQSILV
jgi:nickel-dependent lactate racemase